MRVVRTAFKSNHFVNMVLKVFDQPNFTLDSEFEGDLPFEDEEQVACMKASADSNFVSRAQFLLSSSSSRSILSLLCRSRASRLSGGIDLITFDFCSSSWFAAWRLLTFNCLFSKVIDKKHIHKGDSETRLSSYSLGPFLKKIFNLVRKLLC